MSYFLTVSLVYMLSCYGNCFGDTPITGGFQFGTITGTPSNANMSTNTSPTTARSSSRTTIPSVNNTTTIQSTTTSAAPSPQISTAAQNTTITTSTSPTTKTFQNPISTSTPITSTSAPKLTPAPNTSTTKPITNATTSKPTPTTLTSLKPSTTTATTSKQTTAKATTTTSSRPTTPKQTTTVTTTSSKLTYTSSTTTTPKPTTSVASTPISTIITTTTLPKPTSSKTTLSNTTTTSAITTTLKPTTTVATTTALPKPTLPTYIKPTLRTTPTPAATSIPDTTASPVTDCGEPPSIENGKATNTNIFQGKATYTCNKGYVLELDNGANATCLSTGKWSNTNVTCRIQDCGEPARPDNGDVTRNGTVYQSVATFTCNTGYLLEPDNETDATCLASGQWSASNVTCRIKDCGEPQGLDNGDVTRNSTVYRSVATFTCNTGYLLEPDNVTDATCLASGQWSASNVTCRIKDCGEPARPDNGDVTRNGTVYQSVSTFTCNTGYLLEPDNETDATCLASGQWSASNVTCRIKDCGEPARPDNGDVTRNGTVYQSVSTFTCNTGYLLEPDNETDATCLASGQWSASNVTCRIKDCGEPQGLDNGDVTRNSTVYRSVATFTCNTGYLLEPDNDDNATCLASGQWSASNVTCRIKDCGEPGRPDNGDVTRNGTVYQSVSTFTCNTGYLLEPDNVTDATCLASGQWSASNVTCRIKDCGEPGRPDNGDVTRNGTVYQSGATYTCNTGYVLVTDYNASATCLASGQWSASNVTCRIKDCGEPARPDNGDVTRNGTVYQSVSTFTCNTGYLLDPDNETDATCLASGQWSASNVTCRIKDCGEPQGLDNGDVTRNSTVYRSVATFTCNTGYLLEPDNDDNATCLASGQWSASNVTCRIKDCGEPGRPDNGDVTRNGTVYQSVSTFTCNTGYLLEPDNVTDATCLASGQWSASNVTCRIKDCGEPGRPDNGDVTRNGTVYQSGATYTCNTGYVLVTDYNASATCLASGQWSASNVTCRIKDCGEPGRPDNGDVTRNGTVYQSVSTFTCNTGYLLEPDNVTDATCLASGQWSASNVTCRIKDCGEPQHPDNGDVTSNGTLYQSYATYTCNTGYVIEPHNVTKSICVSTGHWTNTYVTCRINDCGQPDGIANGTVSSPNTTYGSDAYYHCNKGYILRGQSRITCGADGVWTTTKKICIKDINSIKCGPDKDDRDTQWPETKPGEVVVKLCSILQKDGLTGDIKRECGENGIWKLPNYDCISQKLLNIQNEVDNLQRNGSSAAIDNVLTQLSKATSGTENTGALYGGELEKAAAFLETIATVSDNKNVTEQQSEDFLNTASNLLDTTNQKSWEAISDTKDDTEKTNTGAAKILNVIDTYATAIANTLKASGEASRTIENKNMALQVVKVDASRNKAIHFPNDEIKNMVSKSSINLNIGDLKDLSSYSAVIYKDLSGILPSKSKTNNSIAAQEINSAVLSLVIHGKTGKLSDPVTLYLEHFQTNLTNPTCSFWNTTLNAWDTQGCTLKSTNSSITICQCYHLTNFAILMSPWTSDNVLTKALDIISTVGCSVSLAALVITVAMHVALWRYVKSDRVVILVNLSVALTIGYIVFLAGVDRTENKDVCTAIAVVLQYIYLVVFFLMLVEGVELAVTVLYVFTTQSRIKWMLPLAWGVPVVLVGSSMGASQLKGYGTDKFCWLSIEDGLIWSFVGPALCIILVNIVLLILIMKAMFQATTLSKKSQVAKASFHKTTVRSLCAAAFIGMHVVSIMLYVIREFACICWTGVRSMCVLMPLLGCTWVLGMLYVNRDFAWVQYVFAVCNSLQGLVIFIFHCACNPQIRSGIQRRRKKYYDSNSMPSNSTKRFSMPRISTSSGPSEDIDVSYNRSISHDTCTPFTPCSIKDSFTIEVFDEHGQEAIFSVTDHYPSPQEDYPPMRRSSSYTQEHVF